MYVVPRALPTSTCCVLFGRSVLSPVPLHVPPCSCFVPAALGAAKGKGGPLLCSPSPSLQRRKQNPAHCNLVCNVGQDSGGQAQLHRASGSVQARPAL